MRLDKKGVVYAEDNVLSSGANTADDNSQSLPASDTLIFAARPGRTYLLIANPAAANTIYIRLGTVAAVVNGAGTIPIAPGGVFVMDSSYVWEGPVRGIAGTGATNMTAIQKGGTG